MTRASTTSMAREGGVMTHTGSLNFGLEVTLIAPVHTPVVMESYTAIELSKTSVVLPCAHGGEN